MVSPENMYMHVSLFTLIRLYLSIYKYLHTYTHVYVARVNKITGHELEREQKSIYRSVRQRKGKGNDVITLYPQKYITVIHQEKAHPYIILYG